MHRQTGFTASLRDACNENMRDCSTTGGIGGIMKKKSTLRIIVQAAGIILAAVILAAAALVVFLTVREYKPSEHESIRVVSGDSKPLPAGSKIRVLTWNTGYGALGDNADFFMDGGKMVKSADKSRVQENMEAMRDEILKLMPDMIFLQEVDESAGRSYYIDEAEFYREAFPGFDSIFGYNYKVPFVPYPLPPIGKVYAGIETLSAFSIDSAERIQLPCPFSWPVRLANLKRCLLTGRIPIEGTDRELVLVNLHLEAYDSGEGKIAQTEMLKGILESEAAAGNYVIAGGDFNQVFSNADTGAYPAQEGKWAAGEIDVSAFPDDLLFLMDESVPSCRSLDRPYEGADRGTFQYYLIDGFIVSSNIRVESCEGISLDFRNTDHNPVLLTAELIPDDEDPGRVQSGTSGQA